MKEKVLDIVHKSLGILKIKKEERTVSFVFLILILFFQYLIISKFFFLFSDYTGYHWDVFMKNFHMSGFDPITYSVLTDWHQGYDIVRHPLLALMVYPLYLLNQLLWLVTGANCCQLLVGIILLFCSYYSFIFLYRIMTEIIEINETAAALLSFFFFGFAYILVALLVPDHFAISLFLLLLTIYIGGRKLKSKQEFSILETVLLFVITSGVTLSNGVAVGLVVLFVNGLNIFKPKFLLVSFIIPSILLLGTGIGIKNYLGDEAPAVAQQMNWIRQVDKVDVAVENFLGESLQLHRKHILGDVLTKRPVIVRYSWKAQYLFEGIILLLMLIGIILGRKERLLWAVLSIFGFNIALHLLLGFAIDEVYIMTCHWAFVIPISIANIFKNSSKWLAYCSFTAISAITIYLWIYHGYLLFNYLTWPVNC